MSELDDLLANPSINICLEESILLDYVLTLHQWDDILLSKLLVDFKEIRQNNAKVFCGITDLLELPEDEAQLDIIIALVPPIFVIGGQEVGYSLKKKLYQFRYNLQEIKNDSKSETGDKTKDSPSSSNSTFPHATDLP